jgi:hypothetical protein
VRKGHGPFIHPFSALSLLLYCSLPTGPLASSNPPFTQDVRPRIRTPVQEVKGKIRCQTPDRPSRILLLLVFLLGGGFLPGTARIHSCSHAELRITRSRRPSPATQHELSDGSTKDEVLDGSGDGWRWRA